MQKLLCFFSASCNELSSEPLCPSLKLSFVLPLFKSSAPVTRHLLSSTAIAAQLNEQAWILTGHTLAC